VLIEGVHGRPCRRDIARVSDRSALAPCPGAAGISRAKPLARWPRKPDFLETARG
jgi:hypothetical protein